MYRLALTIIVAVLSSLIAPAIGQRLITGKLVDSETKKPVKDALVKIEGTEIQTTSNFLGFFQLNIDTLDHLIIDSDGYELAKIQVPEVNNFQIALQKVAAEQETFLIVEQSATYPGGLPAFYEYIGKNLRYPADAHENGITGKVFVEFVVDTTGLIPHEEINILKGLHKSCDDEVIRVMQGCPRWNPGKQAGIPVRQRMVLPIMFEVGGWRYYKDFYAFMRNNINYPLEARRSGLEGVVLVDFGVDQQGKVTSFNILKDIGGGCAGEVGRALQDVPSELIKELAIESKSTIFTLPVMFGLQKPFKLAEPLQKTNAHRLMPVNITAISVLVERPSQLRLTTNQPVVYELNKALDKPNATRKLSLIDRDYTSFPMDILKLTKLEFLDLERNHIKILPEEIQNLSNLEELYLVENEIEVLPSTFSVLKKIKVLGLASNKLNSFPEIITSLENLEVLDLSGNGLTEIPPSIARLKNLRFLVLQSNSIKTFPIEFYQLKKLESIYLTGNPLDPNEVALLKQHFKKAEIKLE